MFVECPENEATHVEIIKDKDGHYEKCSLTPGKVYKVEIDDEPGFEGDEMIKSDNGNYICSFSIVVEVKWMKEVEATSEESILTIEQ